ncbi:MAG: hypothetical protein ABGW69_01255 [Nanoarchaeota archaeon]
MVSVGIIFGAYSYLFIIALLFKKNPVHFWNKLTLLSPLGIILIRLGNLLNGEAKGIVNYATADILGAISLLLIFILSKKARENAVLVALFFYSFW